MTGVLFGNWALASCHGGKVFRCQYKAQMCRQCCAETKVVADQQEVHLGA